MTNVKTRWNFEDERVGVSQGWYISGWGLTERVASYKPRIAVIDRASSMLGRGGKFAFSSVEEATTHIMTQMLAGDALCYKAMRIVCKTNPAYESYKPMVREVRKKYGW